MPSGACMEVAACWQYMPVAAPPWCWPSLWGRDGCSGCGQGSQLPQEAIEPMLDDVPQHVPFGHVLIYTAIGYGLWYARSSALSQGDVFLTSCVRKLCWRLAPSAVHRYRWPFLLLMLARGWRF